MITQREPVAPWPLTVSPCVKCGKKNWDLAGKPLPGPACPSCLRDYEKVMAKVGAS